MSLESQRVKSCTPLPPFAPPLPPPLPLGHIKTMYGNSTASQKVDQLGREKEIGSTMYPFGSVESAVYGTESARR